VKGETLSKVREIFNSKHDQKVLNAVEGEEGEGEDI
jgi:hypothetical protein